MATTEKGHWEVQVRVEAWRFAAYCFFWTMCGLAIFLSDTLVKKKLQAGANSDIPIEQQGCGPFNRNGGEFNLSYGQGFDFSTQSHLTEYFGFSNICINWDYSPSRELTSLYFPLFEYSLIVYLVLDFVNTKLVYIRGEIPAWFFKLSRAMTIAAIIFSACFRQIFVNIAYESPSKHTAGFLCLQIGVILIAIQNVLYVTLTQQKYKIFCNFELDAHHSTWLGWIYLICNIIVSIPKLSATVFIVLNGVGPEFYRKPGYIRAVLGQDIDLIWMLCNAFLPPIFAYFRMINEAPLIFDVHLPSVSNSPGGEETTPLASSGGEVYSTL